MTIAADKQLSVGLFDLPENLFYAQVDDDLNSQIFEFLLKKYGSFQKALKTLNLSSTFYKWHKRKIFPLCVLKKVVSKASMRCGFVTKHVTAVRSGSYPSPNKATGSLSALIKPVFPITISKELARIIAHLFGDGMLVINKKGHYNIQYYNQNRTLLNQVKSDALELFGLSEIYESINKNTPYISLPTPVGIILHMLVRDFNSHSCEIPEFIKTASDDIKIEFIRAFFDDEASVRYSPPHRRIELTISNSKFLKGIRSILIDIGVLPTKTYYRKMKSKFEVHYFYIIGTHNLKQYYQKVGFSHPEKQNALKQIIDDPGRASYAHGETANKIISLLSDSARTTFELSKKLDRKRVTIGVFLTRLKSTGRVKKVRKGKYITWELANGNIDNM